MKTIIALFLCLQFTNWTNAQTDELNVTKSFLIVKSTKNYKSALKTAQMASQKLDYKLNLNGYVEDSLEGLTSDVICGCGENHGYIPRGKFDDGLYVSIEYSSYFNGFTDGYYIVVVASGERADLKPVLNTVKMTYSDAYLKNSSVDVGGRH